MFVGMDVHRNRTQVCVFGPQRNRGPQQKRRQRPPVAQKGAGGTAAGHAGRLRGGLRHGMDRPELLGDLGFEAHLAHPAGCRAIADAKLKNDRVDARTLANLLRTGYLAEAWLAPKEVREQRLLLRERARLVRIRTSAKNRIRAQIADEGVPAPSHGLWTKQGATFLDTLDLSPMHRWVVTDCRVLIDVLETRISLLEAEIRRQAKPDKRVDALVTIPGIGLLSAMTLVAEIGDVTRFATSRKLCSWAGIIPSMRNSDRTLHHGHITRAGPAAVRHVLSEAADGHPQRALSLRLSGHQAPAWDGHRPDPGGTQAAHRVLPRAVGPRG